MADKDTPMTDISEDTCWGYLASQEVGRLATARDGQPEIFPINFCVDGQSIVFRTASGSKLQELTDNAHVAFEVDGWTEDGGWSILIKGTAEEITSVDELALAEKMPLMPWVPTRKSHFVRVTPDTLSGRSFWFGPEED
ncbi:pyridoxamine 5'-phosphate oxidase family protein [Luteococcus sp. Sow4_B9]|uniref:pyridoxamine 5'-phosphate oxidase family protein n=1 Tax=Luteococcus sp. Sow4_B9 TaxID=3438792 RepID=UPI003F9DB61C